MPKSPRAFLKTILVDLTNETLNSLFVSALITWHS
jgi:hypothetical protein